jgi:hypothetical protein
MLKIQTLVKLVFAKVTAKFDAVVADHFSKAVRKLIGVALLRQFALKLFPIANPPEMLTYGTPSRLAPRFGWMPRAFVGSWDR